MLLCLNKVCVIASPKGVAISRFHPGDCFASLAMTDLPESNAETYPAISYSDYGKSIQVLRIKAYANEPLGEEANEKYFSGEAEATHQKIENHQRPDREKGKGPPEIKTQEGPKRMKKPASGTRDT